MFLVFDIGGTNMKLATSTDGRILGEVKVIPTIKDFNQAILSFKQVAKELSKGQPFNKAAGGVRALDRTKTKLLNHPHFPLWVDEPLKEELEKALSTEVILENDAAVAGLGEAIFGAGKGYSIVVYITISTGVGGVRIVDGKIDKSSQGFEPGNQIIDLAGKTLEAYISGEALERTYQKKADEITDPQIWQEVAKYLAVGLNNVTVFWSPEIIVLGGSVMQSITIDAVRAHLKEVLTIFPNSPNVELAKLGNESGLYGALALTTSLRT